MGYVQLDMLVLRFSKMNWSLQGLSRCCNDCIIKLRLSGLFSRISYSLGEGLGFVREKLEDMPMIHISRGYQGLLERRREARSGTPDESDSDSSQSSSGSSSRSSSPSPSRHR